MASVYKYLIVAFSCIGFLTFGVATTMLYFEMNPIIIQNYSEKIIEKDCKCKINYEGFYISNLNETHVKEYTQEKEPFGDWVCVNVRDIDYKRAVEICQHEVGHEIFAEQCETNITKCMEVIE